MYIQHSADLYSNRIKPLISFVSFCLDSRTTDDDLISRLHTHDDTHSQSKRGAATAVSSDLQRAEQLKSEISSLYISQAYKSFIKRSARENNNSASAAQSLRIPHYLKDVATVEERNDARNDTVRREAKKRDIEEDNSDED